MPKFYSQGLELKRALQRSNSLAGRSYFCKCLFWKLINNVVVTLPLTLPSTSTCMPHRHRLLPRIPSPVPQYSLDSLCHSVFIVNVLIVKKLIFMFSLSETRSGRSVTPPSNFYNPVRNYTDNVPCKTRTALPLSHIISTARFDATALGCTSTCISLCLPNSTPCVNS